MSLLLCILAAERIVKKSDHELKTADGKTLKMVVSKCPSNVYKKFCQLDYAGAEAKKPVGADTVGSFWSGSGSCVLNNNADIRSDVDVDASVLISQFCLIPTILILCLHLKSSMEPWPNCFRLCMTYGTLKHVRAVSQLRFYYKNVINWFDMCVKMQVYDVMNHIFALQLSVCIAINVNAL